MAVCQNLVPLVNIKIAGKWMFIPLKMVLIGIDPYPYIYIYKYHHFRVSNFSIYFHVAPELALFCAAPWLHHCCQSLRSRPSMVMVPVDAPDLMGKLGKRPPWWKKSLAIH